jgi:hypothetical protein
LICDLWEKIGAAPLTRKCLDKPQVRKLIDMDNDYAFLVNPVQEANEYAVYSLTEAGYDGSALQALVTIKPTEHRKSPITERMSRERIELLARANMQQVGVMCVLTIFLKCKHFWGGKRTSR